MSKSENTKENLLRAGRELFANRGYSNVSVRQIAREANVDVALISRYFGSKQGLFEATLDAFGFLCDEAVQTSDDLLDTLTEMFATHPRDGEEASGVTFMLHNANDPEVGQVLRDHYLGTWHRSLAKILGDDTKAAKLSAAILGMSIAEKTLVLPGIPDHTTDQYRATVRGFFEAALV